MPERAFICVPSAWLHDEGLARVSQRARDTFRCFVQCTDANWCFSADPAVIKSEGFPKDPSKRVADVVADIEKLRSVAGALVYHKKDGREWLAVAERLRYRKGVARWGDPEPPPSQQELLLPPQMVEIPVRGEKRRKDPESLPRTLEAEKTRGANRPCGVAQIRVLSHGNAPEEKESDSRSQLFAADEFTFPDDDEWRDLCRILGAREMEQCGQLWMKRWRTCKRAVVEPLRDWMVKVPGERKKGGGNAAAFITEAYRNFMAKTG